MFVESCSFVVSFLILSFLLGCIRWCKFMSWLLSFFAKLSFFLKKDDHVLYFGRDEKLLDKKT